MRMIMINCMPSIKNYEQLQRSKESRIYEIVQDTCHQYIECFYDLNKGDAVILNTGTWKVIQEVR